MANYKLSYAYIMSRSQHHFGTFRKRGCGRGVCRSRGSAGVNVVDRGHVDHGHAQVGRCVDYIVPGPVKFVEPLVDDHLVAVQKRPDHRLEHRLRAAGAQPHHGRDADNAVQRQPRPGNAVDRPVRCVHDPVDE